MQVSRETWILGCILLLFTSTKLVHSEKLKRQIFREQVLPALGGKIPEEAFRIDRLALNRLNKDGITVVNGGILDARHVDKHPTHVRSKPEVIKVYAPSDNRYVSSEGRFTDDQRKTVDTTYVLRKPVGHLKNQESKTNSYQNSISIQGSTEAFSYSNSEKLTSFPSINQESEVHQPIISQLILPASKVFFETAYNHFPWNANYEWDRNYPGSLNDFFYHNAEVFNTHQINAGYDGYPYDFPDHLWKEINSEKY